MVVVRCGVNANEQGLLCECTGINVQTLTQTTITTNDIRS